MSQLVEDIVLISKLAPSELAIQAAKLSAALELAKPTPLRAPPQPPPPRSLTN